MMEKEKYLIAWSGRNQCFYGKDKNGVFCYVDGLTLLQAKRKLKEFPKGRGKQKLLIYKLVETNDSKSK